MHIERNISANVLKHLIGEKDTLEIQRDMEDVGASLHLWLHRILGSPNFIKPKVPYVFTRTENAEFVD
jgi:hypothetical protein